MRLQLTLMSMFVLSANLQASKVYWTLDDVTFANGETAGGTIVVNSMLSNNGFYGVDSWSVAFGNVSGGYPTTSSGTICAGDSGAPGGNGICTQTGYYETTPVQPTLHVSIEKSGLSTDMVLDGFFFPPTAGRIIPLIVSTPTVTESYIASYNFNTKQYAAFSNLVTGSIIESAAPLATLPGGPVSKPAPLPLGQWGGVTGTIGPKGPEQFYFFGWGGGSFSAVGDITGLSPLQNLEDSYFFSMGSSASLCNSEAQEILDSTDDFGADISIADLPAGNYCIGFNPFTGNVDPTFALTFNTPVSGTAGTATPEPTPYGLLFVGLTMIGARGLRSVALPFLATRRPFLAWRFWQEWRKIAANFFCRSGRVRAS